MNSNTCAGVARLKRGKDCLRHSISCLWPCLTLAVTLAATLASLLRVPHVSLCLGDLGPLGLWVAGIQIAGNQSLSNTCFYVLRFRARFCYLLGALGIPEPKQNKEMQTKVTLAEAFAEAKSRQTPWTPADESRLESKRERERLARLAFEASRPQVEETEEVEGEE